jgi:hypothetical protein
LQRWASCSALVCRVGRLFGQPKRSQSCGLFSNRSSLRLVMGSRFLGIVRRLLCLLEPRFGLNTFLRMIRQCCLLVRREMTRSALERDDFSSNRHPALASCWSMILSENRYPPRIKSGASFFGIMLWSSARDHEMAHHHRSDARGDDRVASSAFLLPERWMLFTARGGVPDRSAMTRSCASMTARAGASPSRPPSTSLGTLRLER